MIYYITIFSVLLIPFVLISCASAVNSKIFSYNFRFCCLASYLKSSLSFSHTITSLVFPRLALGLPVHLPPLLPVFFLLAILYPFTFLPVFQVFLSSGTLCILCTTIFLLHASFLPVSWFFPLHHILLFFIFHFIFYLTYLIFFSLSYQHSFTTFLFPVYHFPLPLSFSPFTTFLFFLPSKYFSLLALWTFFALPFFLLHASFLPVSCLLYSFCSHLVSFSLHHILQSFFIFYFIFYLILFSLFY